MQIPDDIRADLDFPTAIKRDLHARPEIGFEEQRTRTIVASLLSEAGIEVHRGLEGAGVVGMLKAGEGSRSRRSL